MGGKGRIEGGEEGRRGGLKEDKRKIKKRLKKSLKTYLKIPTVYHLYHTFNTRTHISMKGYKKNIKCASSSSIRLILSKISVFLDYLLGY